MLKFRIQVRCIPAGLTRAEVLNYFQSFCRHATFSFEKREVSGNSGSARTGMVYLTQLKDVQRLLSSIHMLAGTRLECKQVDADQPAPVPASNLKQRRIFLRNLKKPIEDASLRTFFSSYGEVESAYIVKSNKNGLSRGFGYVTFKEVGPASALLALQQVKIMDHDIQVYPFQKFSETGEPKPQETDLHLEADSKSSSVLKASAEVSNSVENKDVLISQRALSNSDASKSVSPKVRISQTSHTQDSGIRDAGQSAGSGHLLSVRLDHSPSNLVFRFTGPNLSSASSKHHPLGFLYLIKSSL